MENKTLNSNEIARIIPHRYPFILVDRVDAFVPGKWAEGVKCVTQNEMHFMGHFPDHHVMPGVLIIEAMAQLGAIAILMEDEFKGRTAFFAGIKNARFKEQVVPGDVLEMRCELTNIRGSVGFGTATAHVRGKLAAKADISFVIGPKA